MRIYNVFKRLGRGTSLVIQRLRLSALNAGCPESTPSQGARSHMPQLRLSIAK